MVAVENPVLLLSDEFRGQDGFGTPMTNILRVVRRFFHG
jgi:hypothetical protein